MDKKKKKKLFRILFVVSAVIFLIAAGMLISFWWEYHKADEEYQKVAEDAVTVREDLPSAAGSVSGPGPAGSGPEGGNSTAGEILEEEDPNPPRLLVDFDELLTINEDTVAWIDFPGQDISYPVVQGEDNSRYLRWSFYGNSSSSGTLFVDYRNNGLMKDGNTIIYGHNMRNGSMFGLLRRYQEQSHYEEYPYFDVYTPEGVYRCGIISAGRVRPYEESYQIVFADEADRAAYISLVKERQNYEIPMIESSVHVPPAKYVKPAAAGAEDGAETDGLAGAEDGAETDGLMGPEDGAPPLVLLSTCTGSNHDYRFVLLAQVQKFYPEEQN